MCSNGSSCIQRICVADSKELVLCMENMFPQEVLDGFEEETGIKVVYSNIFDTDENMLEKHMAKMERL